MSSSGGSSKIVVLVTGGSGLVGRCLQDEVAQRRNRSEKDQFDRWKFVFLSSRDGDLTNYDEARKLFVEYRPEYVIHLAAKVGGLYANINDKEGLFYKLNKQINENVLRLSFEFNVKRCLSCLSTCIFPDKVELPLDETKIHLGPPHESNFGYAMAKRQVDLLNKQYNSKQQDSTRFFSIIPTNIYGPYDNFCLRNSHVIPGLIHRAHKAATATAAAASASPDSDFCNLIVRGSGSPLRQFIYAPDLARLILRAMTTLNNGDLGQEPSIIMCPDERHEICIGQVAEMIASYFSRKFTVNMRVRYEETTTDGVSQQSKKDGQYRKTASNGKLRRLWPDFEFTPLERGLEQTINWFCSNYPHKVRGA